MKLSTAHKIIADLFSKTVAVQTDGSVLGQMLSQIKLSYDGREDDQDSHADRWEAMRTMSGKVAADPEEPDQLREALAKVEDLERQLYAAKLPLTGDQILYVTRYNAPAIFNTISSGEVDKFVRALFAYPKGRP